MRIFKALKRRSVLSALPDINMARCNAVSLLAAGVVLLLTLICGIIPVFGVFRESYGIYIAGIAGLSLFEAAALRILRSVLINNIYMTGMALILFIMGNEFLESTGSLMFYFVALIFVAVVPVMDFSYLLAVSAAQAAVMITYIVKNIHAPLLIMQVIAVNVIAGAVAVWKYYTVLNYPQPDGRRQENTDIQERDSLTGLVNKSGLFRKASVIFKLCRRNGLPVGLILLDIDQFKKYDDTYGRIRSEECIKNIADTLRETAGSGADIIARVGGKKFALAVQDADKEDIIMLAKLIQSAVKALAIKHAPEADFDCVTVSAGIAFGRPDNGCTFERLYREAEDSLRRAKAKGINGIAGVAMEDNLKCG